MRNAKTTVKSMHGLLVKLNDALSYVLCVGAIAIGEGDVLFFVNFYCFEKVNVIFLQHDMFIVDI